MEMKSWLFRGILTIAIALPALSGAAWADDFKCSAATLQGQYAFGVNIVSQHAVGLGWKYFDGNGNFVQHDYRGNTSPIVFSGEETGTYVISSDCTGSLTTTVGGGGTVVALFVVSDGGRHIHEVVGSLTLPGNVNVPVQTSADDWKVAPEQNQQQ